MGRGICNVDSCEGEQQLLAALLLAHHRLHVQLTVSTGSGNQLLEVSKTSVCNTEAKRSLFLVTPLGPGDRRKQSQDKTALCSHEKVLTS